MNRHQLIPGLEVAHFLGATHHPYYPTPRIERRRNTIMATIVRYAQAMAVDSLACAAQYLRDHHVPIEVAERVLIDRRARA